MAKKGGGGGGIILVFLMILFIFITSFLFGYSEILRQNIQLTGSHLVDLGIYFIIIHVLLFVHIANKSLYSSIVKFTYILGSFFLSFYSTYYVFVDSSINNNGKETEFLEKMFLYVFSDSYLDKSPYVSFFFYGALLWVLMSILLIFTFGKRCPSCNSKKIEKVSERIENQYYEHETKSGKKDQRYKDNKLVSEVVYNYLCYNCGKEWGEEGVIMSDSDKQ